MSTFFISNKNVAQIEEEPKRQYYSFAAKRITKLKDMSNFRDVFHLDKFWLGKNRIMGNISYNTGQVLVTEQNISKTEIRQAIAFTTRIRFWEQFYVNTTFYIDFNKKATARWTSDYSYSIGRYNWKPNKFNFGYENYINNKYSDNLETTLEKFREGYYFLSYSNNIPEKIKKAISLDATTNVRILYFVRYAVHYRDEFDVVHGGIFEGKPSIGLSVRYTIFKNIYAEGALYYYAVAHTRQPWDPDYTYGFGYFDWRSFRLSATYGNWAVNRFSGKKPLYADYGFLDGQFRIIANWIW